ncbi:hypothetical protein GCM10011521_00500 [Arenimonas soli]|uniref:DUF4124 domain-containing protein n=1 Tax=Arenimonas soli TaxID=2269504 RepID=A0ABQ1HAB1_9GAMM|nr:hypothetical protein [Arenimonas soli]GGA66310.1 hypothetical protein GCM10011521_00500 [Arenimonas soli]
MRIPSVILFPALLLSAAGPTAELRKCVAASGAVSYQTLPCADGSHQAWVQPVKAESAPRPRTASAPPAAGPDRGQARRRPSPAAGKARAHGAGTAQARRLRCEKARRQADDLRDRLWNKLDFQQRSELDARVARACARSPGTARQ